MARKLSRLRSDNEQQIRTRIRIRARASGTTDAKTTGRAIRKTEERPPSFALNVATSHFSTNFILTEIIRTMTTHVSRVFSWCFLDKESRRWRISRGCGGSRMRRIALPLEMNCPGGPGHRFKGYVSPLPTQLYVNYAGAMKDGQFR